MTLVANSSVGSPLVDHSFAMPFSPYRISPPLVVNGCDGFLYWCVNYWTDDKVKPFDLFANPIVYPGGNGEGSRFYPDPQKGNPTPSVRAEIFRDGIEDYICFAYFRQKWKRCKNLPTQSAEVVGVGTSVAAVGCLNPRHQQIRGRPRRTATSGVVGSTECRIAIVNEQKVVRSTGIR